MGRASVASLLAATLLLVPALARADAARDVRDIRAGKLPVRHEWLGWEGGRTAHFRTVVCSEGGRTMCSAGFVAILPDAAPKHVPLLDIEDVYCSPHEVCAALDATKAAAFVAAEKKALAAMPVLVRTAALADPTTAFGLVAGAPTRVEVRTIGATKADSPRVMADLVVRGKDGAVDRLALLVDDAYRIESSSLRGGYLSPDGKVAAFAVATDAGVMCWSFQHLATLAVDVARVRARLANTVGFRAWKKSDLVTASAAFTEATTHDASFPLGWYNRAAVESRTGDVPAARASFAQATALDAGFARRACSDRDFEALRSAAPELFTCR